LINVKFAEIYKKSGAIIAELIYTSFGPDFKTRHETIKDNIRTVITKKHIRLEAIHKLFAVCGDNTSPNDTLCDHLH
jgi:hypothetical protein